MIACVKHVTVPVADQDRAIRFYTEKLGFKVTTDADCGTGDGQRWIELDLLGGNTRVVLYTGEEQKDRIGTMQNIIFATQSVAEDYKTLQQKGVQFMSAPIEEPWGTYVIFKDSEGNQFVLSEID